ncbi:cysteine hydrolase family protein [Taklimakanibacter lacteus]|uniref:cysteine hydrolase family protein n=1 Tax=Taklimakanibacter lacteus TaxID=2268456 RepID=UPI000E6663C9
MKPATITRDAPYRREETALLYVDLQTIYCTPGLDPSHPELDENHYYFKRLKATTIPNAQKLLKAARAKGIQVTHTIIEALTRDGRDISLDHRLSNIFVPKGMPEGQPIKELTPIDNEIIFPKSSSGVFNSTNIDYVLKNLGIRYLIISGVITDQCVDMAVRDAADRGYLVTLVEDACATYSQARHDTALKAFGGYCWVSDTETVLKRLEDIA